MKIMKTAEEYMLWVAQYEELTAITMLISKWDGPDL
jgi:hypothetical protein